jgi:hypothetical protein
MPSTVNTVSLSKTVWCAKRRRMSVMEQTLHAPIVTLAYIQETALIDDTPLIITGYPA